jgi:hypothetical protein
MGYHFGEPKHLEKLEKIVVIIIIEIIIKVSLEEFPLNLVERCPVPFP